MDTDKLTVLRNLYEDFLQDKREEEKQNQEYENKIQEIDRFLDSLTDDKNTDFNVFSPRSVERLNREKIDEAKGNREGLVREKQKSNLKLNKLNKQIEQLEQLLSETNNSSDFNTDMLILDIQEKERQRIARELHDTTVQSLTHLIHMIELSSMFIDQDSIRAKLELESCMKYLRESIDDIRDTIFNLRPMSFDDLGFIQCIENFISNLKTQTDSCEIEFVNCDVSDSDWTRQDDSREIYLVTIFRVIQEAMKNSLMHSGAQKLTLKMQKEKRKCLIQICDDGKGFSYEEVLKEKDRHFGLIIMEERVNFLHGRIKINSEPGKGTNIEIKVPF